MGAIRGGFRRSSANPAAFTPLNRRRSLAGACAAPASSCICATSLRNVDVAQCALADAPGALTLTIPIKGHGGLGIALAHLGGTPDNERAVTETVAVRTLDGFMRETRIAACDFIKCDVEGAELLVLKGGLDAIARFKPAPLLEIEADYLKRRGHAIADVEALLREAGYAFYLWRGGSLQAAEGLHDRRSNFAVHTSRRPHSIQQSGAPRRRQAPCLPWISRRARRARSRTMSPPRLFIAEISR
jgi:FkbM family methyltransferase